MLNMVIHTDGGARGNPGPAGIGVLIELDNQTNSKTDNSDNRVEISKYIGEKTNNQAEYEAVIEALKWIHENIKDDIDAEFLLDSELVVHQLNGKYKVKNEGLKPLFWEARDLVLKLGGRVSFSHISREKNQVADKLVNNAIDKAVE